MEHREYKRIVENADAAILFIHGILGTPNHFHKLLPLVPDTVSLYNMLLEGHGKEAQDFSRSSMEIWARQVEAAVEELSSTHKEVYIVGHSMGTLLAIEQAIKNRRIAGLFLLAVPLKVSLKPRMFVNSLKVHFSWINPEDAHAIAARDCYGIRDSRNPLHYIGWIPRFLELLSKIRYTRNQLHALSTPSCAIQSRKDEMVSRRSVDLLRQNPSVCVHELRHSGHYYYEEVDWKLLLEAFQTFVQGISDRPDSPQPS